MSHSSWKNIILFFSHFSARIPGILHHTQSAFLILLAGALFAQSDDIRFEHITVQEGLSQNSVECIFQDKTGFLWFGTRDGLNRYDGYDFNIFHHSPFNEMSLSDNSITVMHEDRSGQMWVGSIGGLDTWDAINKRFHRRFSMPVTSLCEDSTGNLWIGSEEGLFKLNLQTDEINHYRYDPDNVNSLSGNLVTSVLLDTLGHLWIGTFTSGLSKYIPERNQFVHFTHQPDVPGSLSHNHVSAIFEDSEGTLWIGTFGRGLNRFHRETQDFTHYQHRPADPASLSHNSVSSIYEDDRDQLWIGTEGGLNKFDRKTGSFTHYKNNPGNPASLRSDKVASIFQDRSGCFWIGTKGGGVHKFLLNEINFHHYLPVPNKNARLEENMIWTFYEDHLGEFWIGTSRGLAHRSASSEDEMTYHYEYYSGGPGNSENFPVRVICEDDSGNLWAGILGGGLARFNRQKKRLTFYNYDPDEKIYDMVVDDQGIFWIGTNGRGLECFDPETGELSRFSCQFDDSKRGDGWVIDILEDRTGKLWLGTWGDGLIRFDKETGDMTHFLHNPDDPNSINHNIVFSIHQDRDGDLWIGTYGGGLNTFDKQNEIFVAYTRQDGLPNNVVYGILEDKFGNLWLSTNKGLSRFNPGAGIFRNYSVKDGLQNNEFNLGAYYKNSRGELLFGGPNGWNGFIPEHAVNTKAPVVVITAVKKFGRKIWLGKPISEVREIELSYKDDYISFEYVALHYKEPAQNRYAYKLEGFDPDWNYVGTGRQATYTNLDPGDYVFRVKAANCDGLWNEEGAWLRVVIFSPFWKTWWFYLFMLGILFFLVMTIHRYKIRQALKLELARTRERERILRKVTANFHDELGHRITKISLISKILWDKLKNKSGKGEAYLFQKVIENADRLFTEMKEFIWELDPEKDSLYDLVVHFKHNICIIMVTPICIDEWKHSPAAVFFLLMAKKTVSWSAGSQPRGNCIRVTRR